ncbi:hypothetical protein FRC03_002547 [Tulasnella sp. 419]|nr:hypothetical protein FRC03_002547 [Tulasnella sp. 419]
MLSKLTLFSIALATLSLVSASAHKPRTSPSANRTFTCPEQDTEGAALFPNAPNETGKPGLYCDYPGDLGEDGLTYFYCIYDPDNGVLMVDNDLQWCPPNASSSSPSRRRSSRTRALNKVARSAQKNKHEMLQAKISAKRHPKKHS